MLHIQLVQSPVVLVEQKAVQFAVTELNEKVLAIDRRQPVEQIENRGVGGEIAEHLEQICASGDVIAFSRISLAADTRVALAAFWFSCARSLDLLPFS